MNRLIVVTGGTKGIGRAILARFAGAGFDLVTCSRNQGDLDALKLELEEKFKVAVWTRTADLSDKVQAEEFGAFIATLNRPVTVLVNNAGFFIPGRVLNEDDGALESMINSNLFSAYRLSRSVVPGMKERRHGHVFNICSIASLMAYPNGGSYTVSKFALMGFSKVLREELKEYGVRVTAILPGATLTASWEGVALPEERFIPSEDIAEAVFGAYSLSGRSVVEEILIRPQLGDI